MQRPTEIPREEQDREQIEATAQEPLGAELARAPEAGPVLDGDLRHAESIAGDENRDVPIQLAVQLQSGQGFAAEPAEWTVEIVQPDAGDTSYYRIECLRRNPFVRRPLPAKLPARDEIEPPI